MCRFLYQFGRTLIDALDLHYFLKFVAEVSMKWNKVLADAEVEEEKRDLITREIGKFREIMKVSIK